MRIFFSAGEPSGDQHGAHLIQELQRRVGEQPGGAIEPEGFGGPEMRSVGCSLLFQLTDLAVMGFLRILPMVAKFRRVVKLAEKHFDEHPPDAVVLVNFPGFNWWIAKAAKRRGIPVFFYMPPQLWGWAPWRIRRVRKFIDHVICNLPFEYDWYRERGVKASYVGHPFFDEVAEKTLDTNFAADNEIDKSKRVIAVLPGSRGHEIEKNFAEMLKAISGVADQFPDVQWVVGSYNEAQKSACEAIQRDSGISVPLRYVVDKTSEVIDAADCCFMVSGSISLELLARKTPGVVLYRVPLVGHAASKVLMTCDYITLTNLIAGEEIMPEFISSGDPAPDIEAITNQLTAWLVDPSELQAVTQRMSDLADRVVKSGATANTAELILNEIGHGAQVVEQRDAA